MEKLSSHSNNDQLVKSILDIVKDDSFEGHISQKELVKLFQGLKKSAEFEVFCPDNSMRQYLYAKTMGLMKLAYIGSFYRSYKSNIICKLGIGKRDILGDQSKADQMIGKVYILDQSEHLVKEKDFKGAIGLMDTLGQADPKVRAVMEPWVHRAKNRLDSSMIVDVLMTHSDVLVRDAYQAQRAAQ